MYKCTNISMSSASSNMSGGKKLPKPFGRNYWRNQKNKAKKQADSERIAFLENHNSDLQAIVEKQRSHPIHNDEHYQVLYKKIAAVATRDSNGQRRDHISIKDLSDAVQALKQRVEALELKCAHCK